jgi:hypothetical protein
MTDQRDHAQDRLRVSPAPEEDRPSLITEALATDSIPTSAASVPMTTACLICHNVFIVVFLQNKV